MAITKITLQAFSQPAFHAILGSNQTISNETTTVLAYGTEIFDTDGCYDTSTYKFTPTVAGTYLFGAASHVQNADAKTGHTMITKNGLTVSDHKFGGVQTWGNANDYSGQCVSGIIEMNGSSDWVQAVCRHNYGSDRTYIASTQHLYQFFWGFRLSP